ncbi:hypothetical protein Ancab_036771 [Ancistrocladus abbreviatus]
MYKESPSVPHTFTLSNPNYFPTFSFLPTLSPPTQTKIITFLFFKSPPSAEQRENQARGREQNRMETETEAEPGSILQLPLFSLPPIRSSELLTSPLHTAVSVPFRWEEEPGKPRPCTALSLSTNEGIKCLVLPPRLLISNESSKVTKTPSPTTVLEGPYVGRSIFHSSSFRFTRKNNRRSNQESSSSSLDGGSGGSSPDRGLLGAMVLSNSNRRRAFSFRSKREVSSAGSSFVLYENEADDGVDCGGGRMETVKVARMTRKKSLLGLSHARSHFWATIYGAIKQVIPRRSPAKPKWKKKDTF